MTEFLRRRLIGALAAAGSVGVLPAAAQPAELRLGALYPFSGAFALLGDESFRGLDLAVEERNAAGGVLGRPIRLLRGDAADQAQAVAETRRLMTTERVVAVLGTFASPLAFAATQAAELQGIPYFELGAISDPITERGFRHVFRTCPRASDFAREAVAAIADGLVPEWGVPPDALKVAILHEDGLYGQTVAGFEEQQLKARGLVLLEKLAYSARAIDLAGLVQRLKSGDADVVLHTGYQNDIVLFYRAMRDTGWRPRMVIGAGAGYSLGDTARAIGADFNGTMNVDFTQYEVNERVAPGIRLFVELYTRKYGSEPRSGHSLANYCGARIAFDVLTRAGAPDVQRATERDRIRAAVLATDIAEGTTPNGWGARFDERGQNLRARPFVVQWQGTRQVTVFPPEAAVASLWPRLGGNG